MNKIPRPTDEQIIQCLLEWVLIGETFHDNDRMRVAHKYADGYEYFSAPTLDVIQTTGNNQWKITKAGFEFLTREK